MNSSKSDPGVEPATLPIEIIEHVLSFFTVPELCRIRSVCKSWNQIVTKPSFHDLCDVNGRNQADENLYLFMCGGSGSVSRLLADTVSFLDVNARRWYSIPTADLPRLCGCGHEVVESRFLGMNDGLVCVLTYGKHCADEKFYLAVLDPVSKTRRMLPAPPKVFDHTFQIVTAVNDATSSFKVFLFGNPYPALRAQSRVHVHDSFTDEWRALRTVPNGVDEEYWAWSAVVLHESLFVLESDVNFIIDFDGFNSLRLFRYRFQEDTGAEAYRMHFPWSLQYAHLAVSGNRLFLNMWLEGSCSSDPLLNPRAFDDPDWRPHPNWPETDTWFEMYEVQIGEYRRIPVVQLTGSQLAHIFGMDSSELVVQRAFPCVGSNGICSSVVLVHWSSSIGFEFRKYDLATGSVDVLPPYPFSDAKPASKPTEAYFDAVNMKLSLRNLLAQSPKR